MIAGQSFQVPPLRVRLPDSSVLSGAGDNRLLGLTPEPALWEMWKSVVDGHRNFNLA